MVQVVLVSASRVACLESVTRSNTTEPVFILPHRACYFTTWSRYRPVPGKYLPANVDPNLCTILIYAFGQITNNTISTRSPKDEG
ncbi:hypothetical protein BV898_12882 [Hypsibius exemplaris]|uniref:GH18 domain-containing protein n=1 Tax=Hypsibius exemplaris TaxID=2072580 RepID=A0A1W0WCH0_HYPEX|nr:hypothetical protein BV898_12882 [Hypsibius exemplaris]